LRIPSDIRKALHDIGQLADDDVDLAETALLLATIGRPAVQLESYRRHLATLCSDVSRYLSGLSRPPELTDCHEALVQILFRRYGYMGTEESFNDQDAANLTYVIDRRSGLPVQLGLLYIHVARQQGWQAEGLSFPGRFLFRLEVNGERFIIDPYDGGAVVSPHDLRGLLKTISGAHAELLPDYYQAVSPRAVLLRIQNNIYNRLLRAGYIEEAVDVIRIMLLFAPKATDLWRECGLLYARLDNIEQAIKALETYLGFDTGGDSRYNASMLLQELRQRLN